MKQEEINKLLEKFFAGETTESEESQLKSWLQTEDVPAELEAVKSYFQAMHELKEEKPDDAFEETLMERLTKEEPDRKSRFRIYSLTSVAATIAVFLAVWMGINLFRPTEVYGTIKDPKIAFAETKRILQEVSAKMNEGLEPAEKTVKTVEKNVKKAGEAKKINEVLQKVGYIIKVERINDLLKPLKKENTKNGKS